MDVYSFLATLTTKQLYNFCMDLGLDNYAVVSLMSKISSAPEASKISSAPEASKPLTTFTLRCWDASPRKIQAIKTVREYTGYGLKDAKEVIDKMVFHRQRPMTYDTAWYAFVDAMYDCGYTVDWAPEPVVR